MIFKNINPYQLSQGVDTESLTRLLSENEFVSCLPQQESSAGFVRINGGKDFVISAKEANLFCLKVEEKKVPPSVVNDLYRTLLAEEARRGRVLSASEKRELKEQARKKLLPKTFGRISKVWAYIDNQNLTLIVNTSSPKVADGLASTIRNRFSSLDVRPFRPERDVSQVLKDWMLRGVAPAPFSLGRKCEINDGTGTIKYRNRSLDDEQLRQYLLDDLSLLALGLKYEDKCEFLLGTDFEIKEFDCAYAQQENIARQNMIGLSIEDELSNMAALIRNCLRDLRAKIDCCG